MAAAYHNFWSLGMFGLHHLRLLLLVVAFGLAGALAWQMTRGQAPPLAPIALPRDAAPPSLEAIAAERRAISERISNTPEFWAFVERFSNAYPSDWNKLLDAFAHRSLYAHAAETPEVYVSDAIRALRRDRGVMASRAGPEALARVFDAQAQLLGGLAGADKRLCVDFLLGQASPAFLEFAGRSKGLLAELAMSSLDAMIEGESRRNERQPPGDADFEMLEASLVQHGLGKPEIGALLDGRLPEPAISDAVLCDAGLVYFDALKSLPEDARMRLYSLAVQIMGRS